MRIGLTIQPNHAMVLTDDGIDSCLEEFVGELYGLRQLVCVEEGVEGGIDPDTKGACILHDLTYVVSGIACRGTCPETMGSDIYGIGSVVDGSNGRLFVFGRGKEFDISHWILSMSKGVS